MQALYIGSCLITIIWIIRLLHIYNFTELQTIGMEWKEPADHNLVLWIRFWMATYMSTCVKKYVVDLRFIRFLKYCTFAIVEKEIKNLSSDSRTNQLGNRHVMWGNSNELTREDCYGRLSPEQDEDAEPEVANYCGISVFGEHTHKKQVFSLLFLLNRIPLYPPPVLMADAMTVPVASQ